MLGPQKSRKRRRLPKEQRKTGSLLRKRQLRPLNRDDRKKRERSKGQLRELKERDKKN